MQPFRIEEHYNAEPVQSRRGDPWAVKPDLDKTSVLYDLLQQRDIGVLAAHVIATVKTAKARDPVKYRRSYKGHKGHGAVMDMEHGGILYRQVGGLIYTKRSDAAK